MLIFMLSVHGFVGSIDLKGLVIEVDLVGALGRDFGQSDFIL